MCLILMHLCMICDWHCFIWSRSYFCILFVGFTNLFGQLQVLILVQRFELREGKEKWVGFCFRKLLDGSDRIRCKFVPIFFLLWGGVLLSLSFLIFKCVCFGKFLSFVCFLMLMVFKMVMIWLKCLLFHWPNVSSLVKYYLLILECMLGENWSCNLSLSTSCCYLERFKESAESCCLSTDVGLFLIDLCLFMRYFCLSTLAKLGGNDCCFVAIFL